MSAYRQVSLLLLAVACGNCKAMKKTSGTTVPGSMDVLGVVFLSVASLEAYINELHLFIKLFAKNQPQNPVLNELLDKLGSAIDCRESVAAKFQLSKQILPGGGYNTGVLPYQNFDLLIRLRNEIVHMKPYDSEGDPPKFVRQLRSQKLCKDLTSSLDSSIGVDWVYEISTIAVGKWACETSVSMIRSINDSLREIGEPIENQLCRVVDEILDGLST